MKYLLLSLVFLCACSTTSYKSDCEKQIEAVFQAQIQQALAAVKRVDLSRSDMDFVKDRLCTEYQRKKLREQRLENLHKM